MTSSSSRAPGAPSIRTARRLPAAVALLTCAAVAQPILAQAVLGEPAAQAVTLVGRVCLYAEEAERCASGAMPAPGLIVRTSNGLEAITDESGRFHLAAIPGRRTAVDAAGGRLERLPHIAVTVDVSPLGPRAVAPPPVWVDLVPGSTAAVDLVIRLPELPLAPDAISGAATGEVPAIELHEEGLRYYVPLVLPAGHDVRVDGAIVAPDADGVRRVRVLVGEREGDAIVVDRAPGGRVRLLRQTVLRVPRPRRGDLFVPRPIAELATFDLPPPQMPVAPDALRVPVAAAPGTLVRVGLAEPETLGETGRAVIRTQVPLDGRLRLVAGVADAPVAEAEVVVAVDPRAGDLRFGALDLRAGLSRESAFVEGRLAGQGRRSLLGGSLFGGVEVGDDDVSRWTEGGRPLAARRVGIIDRFPDPVVHGAVFGDESRTVDRNPAGLTVWGGWEGPPGRAALGTGRTGLSGGEVGRFDRPVVGPHMDLSGRAGPLGMRLHGGADLGGTGVLEPSALLFARAELTGTGGAFYWLPHREVAEGSERVWIESRDPRTGLIADRRLLVRGMDYELDYPTGRLRLAAPAGWHGTPSAGRLSASGLGWESVVIVDYAHLATNGFVPDAGHGALRLAVAAANVEVGVRGAGGWGGFFGDHRIGGIDLHAEPVPWISVAGSVARSRGDPFMPGGASFHRSLDGGLSHRRPVHHPGPPGTVLAEPAGDASSLRLRLGHEEMGVTGWWSGQSDGYGDGAIPVEPGHRQVGGLGRAKFADIAFELMGDHREQRVPDATDRLTLVTGRAARRLGPITVAGEALHRRGRLRPDAGVDFVDVADSQTTAVGAEITWHASDRLDLSVGHLQALSSDDRHRAGRDPTFTSAGMKLRLSAVDEVEVRGGVRPDLTPALSARWHRDAGEGDLVYGGIAAGTDAPWDPRGATSVSGARRIHAPGVSTFVERRLVEDGLGMRTGQAVGLDVSEGPFHGTASYERGERWDDTEDAVRDGLHGALGVRLPRLQVGAFGEMIRAVTALEAGHLRAWHAGVFARAQPVDTLSVGGRLVTGNVSGPAGRQLLPGRAPSHEAVVGGAWRPATGDMLTPALLFHYGLRQERPLLDPGVVDAPSRRQFARVGLVLGTLPGPEVRLTALGATDALVMTPLAGEAARAGVLSARLGWPVGLVEPAVEAGWRWVAGAGLPTRAEPTLRTELLAVLGPARVGVGGVLAGFAGTGIEEDETRLPRVYVVVRGAVQ